jgi:beta-N-acetylhexosaminidase
MMDMHLEDFSNEQLAGQRLMVGFEGTDLDEDLKFLIREIRAGGLILFAYNLETPDQIRNLCLAAQEYAANCGQPPLFVAIDQEGGQVARLKAPFTRFPGNPSMRNEADAVHFAEVTATELHQVGINMDMAPVVDIAPEDMNSIMVGRSFGGDPERVARLGTTVVDHLQRNRIMAVAKHFPGIGRTVMDSHLDMPTLNDDVASLERYDLIPFQACIQHDVSGLMLSHIFYPQLDEQWPASLSPRIAKDLLRQRLGYTGLVMTDDLDMGAIVKHYDITDCMGQILAADIDLALICHKGPNIEIAFDHILKSITDSAAVKNKCLQSMERIALSKRRYLQSEFGDKKKMKKNLKF